MKSILPTFILLLLFTHLSYSQTKIEFDSCFVYNRLHADSLFKGSGLFVGDGEILVYRDSIVLSFSNEWECGKYLIDLYDADGEIDGDNFIWYYWGRERYRTWDMSIMMVVDKANNPIHFEMRSGFSNLGGESFAQTSRIYRIYR